VRIGVDEGLVWHPAGERATEQPAAAFRVATESSHRGTPVVRAPEQVSAACTLEQRVDARRLDGVTATDRQDAEIAVVQVGLQVRVMDRPQSVTVT
jgi:hypothetical protein